MLNHSAIQNSEVHTLSLQGPLNADVMDDIRDLFDEIVFQVKEDIVIDLSHVSKLDSSGVGALVFLFKRLKSANRNLRIIGVTGQPEAIIRLLRMEKTIETEFLN
ncbi:STAS domain-containing protein [Curvivirga sp.]|uniref:STAS domain-containing protein n=1 Tax=Curvivirga sp. TaxID=2856848 RepID=UPI003B5CE8CB